MEGAPPPLAGYPRQIEITRQHTTWRGGEVAIRPPGGAVLKPRDRSGAGLRVPFYAGQKRVTPPSPCCRQVYWKPRTDFMRSAFSLLFALMCPSVCVCVGVRMCERVCGCVLESVVLRQFFISKCDVIKMA